MKGMFFGCVRLTGKVGIEALGAGGSAVSGGGEVLERAER